jgi:hypothetical protein
MTQRTDMTNDQIKEEAYRLYQAQGQSAVEKFAVEIGITDSAYCQGCEDDEPVVDGECLVCGSVIESD